MSDRRAALPLDSAAVKAADDTLYARHAGDKRPNALFDEFGNRKPLSATDPSQADLRKEWMDLYVDNGGPLEGEKPPAGDPEQQPPDQPVEECPPELADLIVHVDWTPRTAPVENAKVKIEGPITAEATTGKSGVAEFRGIPAGGYTVTASMDSGYPLADQAHTEIGSMDWAVWQSRPPYPADTNKCNLFVFEMANSAGHKVPMNERRSISQWKIVKYPPLAGEWADPSEKIGDWKPVNDPLPGDVIAEARFYLNASGHVGIIGYPEPNGLSTELAPDEEKHVDVPLQRLTVSAGADEVLHNDWGWRAENENPQFRRYSP